MDLTIYLIITAITFCFLALIWKSSDVINLVLKLFFIVMGGWSVISLLISLGVVVKL